MADGRTDTFEVGLAAIRRRERSTAELKDWLLERDHELEDVDAAVERLLECGELDDERFARLYAQDKRELSGWGPARIAAVLRERGIDRDLIELACADPYEAQLERAVALLRARRTPLEGDTALERALGMLARRGYGSEVAYEAIRIAAPPG